MISYDDEYFMNIALKEAQIAMDNMEVPVGAVVKSGDRIIAKAHNQTERLQDATAHAEMLAITAAMSLIGNKYLQECTLYVTLEPCVMCAGALRWAQIGKIIYAAEDLKNGFMRYGKELVHPKCIIQYGIKKRESEALLKSFFQSKRN